VIAVGAHPGQHGGPSVAQPRRVLVVDDEEVICSLAGAMLEALGCCVVTSRDPVAAWHLVERDPFAFDLLITDQTMPGSSGLELARLVHRLRPDLPVVITTGCADLVDSAEADAAGVLGLMQKPFDRRGFSDLVVGILGHAPLGTHVATG
jgi:DNA-binding NtrC family response regulator